MPCYEYRCDKCGKTHEQWRKMDEPPMKSCPVCGLPVRRLFNAHTEHCEGWPMVAESQGTLDPKGAAEFCEKHGCPTEYNKRGKPIWTNKAHKEKWIKTVLGKTGHETN